MLNIIRATILIGFILLPFKFSGANPLIPQPENLYIREISDISASTDVGSQRLMVAIFGTTALVAHSYARFEIDDYLNQSVLLHLEKPSKVHYQPILKAGYGWNIGTRDLTVLKMDLINGVSFKYVSLGAGIGLRILSESSDMVIPVYIDVRSVPGKNKATPMAGFNFGTLLQQNQQNGDRGLYVGIEGGVYLGGPRTSILISITFEKYDVALERSSFFQGSSVNEVEIVSGNFSIFF